MDLKKIKLKTAVTGLLVASVYLAITIWLMNATLVKGTILGLYPMHYKVAVLLGLLQGMWTSMSSINIGLLIISSLLTGLNIALLFFQLAKQQRSKKFGLVASGSTLGIIGGGCVSCGIPLLSLVGLSGGSLYWLPLQGVEISLLAITLLTVSLFIFLRKTDKSYCPVETNIGILQPVGNKSL